MVRDPLLQFIALGALIFFGVIVLDNETPDGALAAGSLADPSEDELRTFYATHTEEFREPARVSFSHIYFSPDIGDARAAQSRANDTLEILRSECEVVQSVGVGDPFPLQMQYIGLGPKDVAQLFGNTDIVDGLFSGPAVGWSGPYASDYGLHLVWISDRTQENIPPFEDVVDDIRSAYQARQH